MDWDEIVYQPRWARFVTIHQKPQRIREKALGSVDEHVVYA